MVPQQVHLAVRAAKKAGNQLNSEALHTAATSGNKELFDEMKKYLNGGNSGQSIPDTL